MNNCGKSAAVRSTDWLLFGTLCQFRRATKQQPTSAYRFTPKTLWAAAIQKVKSK